MYLRNRSAAVRSQVSPRTWEVMVKMRATQPLSVSRAAVHCVPLFFLSHRQPSRLELRSLVTVPPPSDKARNYFKNTAEEHQMKERKNTINNKQ